MNDPHDDKGVPSGFNDDAEMERTPPRVRQKIAKLIIEFARLPLPRLRTAVAFQCESRAFVSSFACAHFRCCELQIAEMGGA